MWLEAERLDQALKREMGEAPQPPREGPPRDVPPPEALERAFNAAREALAGKRWEAAEGALRHAVEILAGMVRRPELGPEDARWCRGRIEKLMGGAAAFKEAGREDMAEFLQGAAKRLMGALDARKGRESPEKRPDLAKLEQHLRELGKERENLGRRMEELEGARREIAQNVERREAAVREAEGERREALKRELQAVIEKLERVAAELNEVGAHAKKIEAERDRVAAELKNVRREGDRERPRAERPVRRDGDAAPERPVRRDGDVERERPVKRDGDAVRERPDEARAEIEALRAEVRELRRLLKEALKRD
ncbi:MAG TPA: hypothetical protein DCM87_15155 [Planctomycetes bacterium]|nr:hypothetical protein [Planctomycetota bacterium]